MHFALVSAGNVLVLLALVASACGPQDTSLDITYDACQPLTVELPADATDAQRTSTTEAINMWNDLGVTQLTLDAMPGAAAMPIRFEDAAGAFHGLYEDETGTLFVNRGLTRSRARTITIAHELGHAFGLLHIDEHHRRSVMNEANLDVEPNADDARALEAVRGPCAVGDAGESTQPD